MADYELLLDAVDALTFPVNATSWVGPEENRTLFRRTDPPLLEQLQSAVASSLGGSSGAGKSSRERTPIDVGALTLLEEIDGEARAWLDDLGARPGRTVPTGQALRAWFVLFKAVERPDELIARHERRIRSWTARIVDKLNPPPSFEITAPCPHCEVEWVRRGGNADEDELMRSLVVVEREPLPASRAQCRSCGTSWQGIHALRQLRIAIDDAEQAKAADLVEVSNG